MLTDMSEHIFEVMINTTLSLTQRCCTPIRLIFISKSDFCSRGAIHMIDDTE